MTRRTRSLVALGVLLGCAISLQGWRTRGPDGDIIIAIAHAKVFLHDRTVPTHGSLTDLGSYYPPGMDWLVLPGALVSDDVRVIEVVGGIALYVGGVIGVFLIGRRYLGVEAAVFAALLYAASAIALDLATHLWPRAFPFFSIWMAYFAGRWIDERNSRYLAAAVVVWATGMLVYLELAPFILMLPAVWAYYRPPITWSSCGVACIAALLLWSPYLRFERSRDFIDLESQLLLRKLSSEQVALSDCGPTAYHTRLASNPSSELIDTLRSSLTRIPRLAAANFRTDVKYGSWLLLGVVIAAAAMIFAASGPSLALLLMLMPPWLVFLALTEADSRDRMLALWPLQVLVLAAPLSMTRRRPRLALALAGIAAIVVTLNPVALERLQSWQRNGWSGENVPPTVTASELARMCGGRS